MSYNKTVSFEVGYKQLQQEQASGTPTPTSKPQALNLESIRMAHSVFQPRGFAETASSEEHVRVLLKAISTASGKRFRSGRSLVVWWLLACVRWSS